MNSTNHQQDKQDDNPDLRHPRTPTETRPGRIVITQQTGRKVER